MTDPTCRRLQPKKVVYTDTETGEVITYGSIYKAVKETGHGPGFYIYKRNRQDGKYMVVVE